MKKLVLSFDQHLNESVATTPHFDLRVTQRIFKAYIKSMVPVEGGAPLDVPKEQYNDIARRIKYSLGEAIKTVRSNNRIRQSAFGRFQIIQLPKVMAKANERLFEPRFAIKDPRIEGSIYYLVGRNGNLKTVLLFGSIEPSKTFLLGKMMNNIKNHKDLKDDADFEELMNMSYQTMEDKTDFFTSSETGTKELIVDMAMDDETFKVDLQKQLHGEEHLAQKDNISFSEIIGKAVDVTKGAIPEKQFAAGKGRTFPVEIAGEFKLGEIDDVKFFKAPTCIQIFTKLDGKPMMPSLLVKSDYLLQAKKQGLDKIKGVQLKVREKIWIKPERVTEFDLETGKKLFGLENLTIHDMQFAYFYGEITEITSSSRDGIIVKILPSKMIFYRKGRVIAESESRKKF